MINTQLFPFVDLDVMLLYTEIGHEMPKHISIILSNIDCILFFLFRFLFTVYSLTI